MLTPRDIETREFTHGKGYKAEEVEAFLDEILVDYSALIEERDNLSRRVLALSEKLENVRDEQEAWKQTLLNTQKSYDEVMQIAKDNSAKIIEEAEKEAAQIKQTAVEQARSATEDADKQRAEKNALADEIANFKSKMLGIYEEHIKNLNNLPEITKEVLVGYNVEMPTQKREPEAVINSSSLEETKVIPNVTKIADTSKAATRAKINKALDIIGTDYDEDDDDDFLIKESARRRAKELRDEADEKDIRDNKIRDLIGSDSKKKQKEHGKAKRVSRFFIDDDDDDDDFYDDDDE